jgi:histidine-specific SAM-dependent methyltransferase
MSSTSSDRRLPAPASTIAERIPAIAGALQRSRSPFGFVLSEMQPTDRIGEVMNAIKGIESESKYIKDGYQYVGDGPAHLWKLATADDQYKTMNYGIMNFHEEWSEIRETLTTPYHYVSIGPGTGEKDQEILRHLSSLGGTDTIVYVPVDISPQLLRIGISAGMRGISRDRVELLPTELDITSERGLATLKIITEELGKTAGVIISLLGNTLSNFRDPAPMLAGMGSLLSSDNDRLFLELATTDKANDTQVKRAVGEYQGSDLFLQFAMATLCDYTDLPRETEPVTSTGEAEGDVIKVTTSYRPNKARRVRIGNSSTFSLNRNEPIELIVCRKYTDKALTSMLDSFTVLATHNAPLSRGFGSNMYLLARPGEQSKHTTSPHPVAAMPTTNN